MTRRAGGHVHLVGHSFGGTVALAAGLGRAIDVASVSLFEANPLSVLRAHPNYALHQEAYALSRQFEAEVDDDPFAAGLFIDFWGGDGTFAQCRSLSGTTAAKRHLRTSWTGVPISASTPRATTTPF
ncbi:alpha/beta fold hydrolase [Neoaquamicrobium sediminum]|uniref:alpha/beta fold hydrolase n=1 Tax=Neoaquamicrobium sediminum TaxID=1849104 RepID=UPI0034D60E02